MKRKHLSLLYTLIALWLCACSNDDLQRPGEEAGDSNVVVHVSTRGNLTPAQADIEKIQRYWIVFTQNGTIAKIIKSGSLTAAVEEHESPCVLANGTYRAYAFANMPDDYLTGIGLVEGQTMPTLTDKYYNVTNGWNTAIPMSGSAEGMPVTIGDGTRLAVDIEVIRMVAKLEFLLTNSSEDDITLKQIGVGPLTKSGASGACIPLMTYDDASALTLASDVTSEDYLYTLPSPISLAANTTTPQSVSFYVVESTPNSLSNAFSLSFAVQQGTLPEDIRYALLDKTQAINQTGTNLDGDLDKSPFIRRNDWLRIPVDFGSYEFKLEARSYPPIGGYPEVDVTQSADGLFAQFTLPGTFSLRPAIRQYGTIDWIYLDESAKIESYTFTVDTDAEHGFTNIFSKTPSKKGNEIVGAIAASVHGTALISLTVHVKLAGGGTRQLTRKMYVSI